MDTVIQNLINGALMGCIYALITLGLSIIYGVMNVVNFAHGDFVMLSMYFTFWVGTLWSVDAVATPQSERDKLRETASSLAIRTRNHLRTCLTIQSEIPGLVSEAQQ